MIIYSTVYLACFPTYLQFGDQIHTFSAVKLPLLTIFSKYSTVLSNWCNMLGIPTTSPITPHHSKSSCLLELFEALLYCIQHKTSSLVMPYMNAPKVAPCCQSVPRKPDRRTVANALYIPAHFLCTLHSSLAHKCCLLSYLSSFLFRPAPRWDILVIRCVYAGQRVLLSQTAW